MESARTIFRKFIRHVLLHPPDELDIEKIIDMYLPGFTKAILEKQLLTSTQVEKFFPAITERMLQNMRYRKTGPPYIKIGQFTKSRVFYRMADILKWLDKHTIETHDL